MSLIYQMMEIMKILIKIKNQKIKKIMKMMTKMRIQNGYLHQILY